MLYVIAGNGTGPVKEINAALKDLKEAAAKEDAEFWFLIEGKDETTATDDAILKWLRAQEVWFEVYSAGGVTYEGAQDTIAADDVFAGFLERMNEVAGTDEEVALLILPADESGESDEDEELSALVEQVIDAGFPVYALNGEMAPITLEDEPEAEPAPEPVKGAVKKTAAKKAAAPAAAPATKKAAPTKAVAKKATDGQEDQQLPGLEDAPEDGQVYSQEALLKMSVAELTAIARSQGVDTKGLSKKDLVTAVMTATEAGVEVVDEVVETAISTNGDQVVEAGGDTMLVVIHYPGRVVSVIVPAETALGLISA